MDDFERAQRLEQELTARGLISIESNDRHPDWLDTNLFSAAIPRDASDIATIVAIARKWSVNQSYGIHNAILESRLLKGEGIRIWSHYNEGMPMRQFLAEAGFNF